MSVTIKGMATVNTEVVETQAKANLEGFKKIQGETPEEYIRYVTSAPVETIYDIRIGTDYADEIIRGLRYQNTGNLIFEVPKKYKERFERNIRVKSGGVVIING